MSVLLPSGTFTVRWRVSVRDSHGTPVIGPPVDQWVGPGRVRDNGNGVDIALDPAAWPAARVIAERVTELVGPDVDGVPRVWTLQDAQSSLRKGLTPQLDGLSYVQAFGQRSDL